jgi:hypothetical protein
MTPTPLSRSTLRAAMSLSTGRRESDPSAVWQWTGDGVWSRGASEAVAPVVKVVEELLGVLVEGSGVMAGGGWGL